MPQDWTSWFSLGARHYQGYSIGKLFTLLKDPEIISLAGGLPSPEMLLTEELLAASQARLAEDAGRIMQYSAIPGEPELIQAVMAFLARDGIHVRDDQVLITSSGQHGLDLVGRLLLDPQDVVLLDRPTFAGAIVAFQLQRPQFEGIDLEPDGSDVDQYARRLAKLQAARKRPKFIYVVPDYQNPTGITMSLEKREALLQLSARHGVPIVEDSPYRELRYRGERIPSLYELDQQSGGGHVIGVYTFSKLFCPGMRVGFNIGPRQVIEKMTNIKEGGVLNTPKYNQDMCSAFLRHTDWPAYLERCRSYYRNKLDLALETLERTFSGLDGITWTRPEGGLFLWISAPPGVDTMALFHKAVEFKVAFVPGSAFYGEQPAANHMRINFSFPSQDQLVEGIGRLAACLEEHLATQASSSLT